MAWLKIAFAYTIRPLVFSLHNAHIGILSDTAQYLPSKMVDLDGITFDRLGGIWDTESHMRGAEWWDNNWANSALHIHHLRIPNWLTPF